MDIAPRESSQRQQGAKRNRREEAGAENLGGPRRPKANPATANANPRVATQRRRIRRARNRDQKQELPPARKRPPGASRRRRHRAANRSRRRVAHRKPAGGQSRIRRNGSARRHDPHRILVASAAERASIANAIQAMCIVVGFRLKVGCGRQVEFSPEQPTVDRLPSFRFVLPFRIVA